MIIILVGTAALPNFEVGGSDQPLQNYSFVKEWRFDARPTGEAGIATDLLGKYVYVTDSVRHKILKFSSNGTFLMQWGKEGSANGEFQEPTDVAVDSQGNVYVTEYYGSRVQKFTENGEYLTQWAIAAQGQLGIAIDRSNDLVYVANTGLNQLLKYSSDGTFIATIGGSTSTGELSYPMDIALDSEGNLFVADSHNNRIRMFSSDGTYLREWEKFDKSTDIWNPVSLSLDANGTMYIASSGINKLHQDGTYAGMLGSSADALDLTIDNANGYVYALEGSFGTAVSKYSLKDGGSLVSKWLPQNPADNIVGSITSMKTDLEGNLYILDSSFSRIHKYSPDGKVLARWGFLGSGDGEFKSAADFAIDQSGNVYVIDEDLLRVQKFTSDGQLIGKWGGGLPDSIPGGLYWPRTIAVNSEGTVLIGDVANVRISMFTANGTFGSIWNASGPVPDSFSQVDFHHAESLEFDSQDNLYMTSLTYPDGSPYMPDMIVKFNKARELIAAWDSFQGKKLQAISGMAIDAENNVYVTNAESSVLKFTSDGLALAKWNPVAADDGMSEQISAITVDNTGLVYVADVDEWLQQSRIQVFATEGSSSISDKAPTINVPHGGLLVANATDADLFSMNVTYVVTASDDHDDEGSIIPSCSPPSGSAFPVGYNMTVVCVATDSAGNSASKSFVVKVNAPVRPGAAEIQLPEFREHYNVVSSWGSAIDGNDLYLQPQAVALDDEDNVYVVGYGKHPIQKYDKNGTSLGEWGLPSSESDQFAFPIGIAVNSARDLVYVTDFDIGKVAVFTTNGSFVKIWGSMGSDDGQFSSPYGIAVDSQGFVYVVDTGNQRIQKFSGDGEFVAKWGVGQTGDGTQDDVSAYPVRIAVQDVNASDALLYVTDSGASNVLKFTSDGTFLTSWSSGSEPQGIAIDPRDSSVYVADFLGSGVERYDENGNYYSTILNSTDSKSGNTLFVNPTDIAIDSGGSMYVVTQGTILKFNAEHLHSFSIRYPHGAIGSFYDPFRIAIDQLTGHVYVADYGSPRIQKFNNNGTFLNQWVPEYLGNGDQLISLSSGSLSDMAINSEGIVYLLEQKVYMFDEDGRYIGEWGSTGADIDALNGPVTIAVDSQDNVLIANAIDYSVKKFSANGQFVLGWKTDDPVANPETASPPSVIAVDSDNNVYVLDTHFNKIKVYASDGSFVKVWNNSLASEMEEQVPNYDPYAIRAVALAIDKEDNVYISYTGGHIRKFLNNGTFLTEIGPVISNDTQSYWLPDMAVNNESGNLYVIDGRYSKIAILASDRQVVVPEFGPIVLLILLAMSIAGVITIRRIIKSV